MAKKASAKKVPPCIRWARLGEERVVTNDAGEYLLLKPAAFEKFARTGRAGSSVQRAAMRSAGFIREQLDFGDQAGKWSASNAYLRRGPGLHIMVLTLKCDHKCVYCQAGAGGEAGSMDLRTARACVDFILSSPEKGLTIEFQGGEPLLNWDVLKKTVLYAESRARRAGKELKFALVSNFSRMTREKADFLIRRGVALCTSLDGPAAVHDRNRPRPGGGSHAAAVKWLRSFRKELGPDSDCGPGALLTVSRSSLGKAEKIVDEYVRLGLSSVFIRPPSPLGFARERWDRAGCSAKEFAEFYRAGLARVVEWNLKGVRLKEKTAFLIVKKALGFEDTHYVDLRCPCGAGLGQLAYDFNGDVYTCDEGRMLARQGERLFKAGDVFKSRYSGVINSAAVKACASASSLDAQPSCARCAWRPYCGVCPVYNYQTQGSLWGNMAVNDRCLIMKGIFAAVFGLLKDPAVRDGVFRKWLAPEKKGA